MRPARAITLDDVSGPIINMSFGGVSDADVPLWVERAENRSACCQQRITHGRFQIIDVDQRQNLLFPTSAARRNGSKAQPDPDLSRARAPSLGTVLLHQRA